MEKKLMTSSPAPEVYNVLQCRLKDSAMAINNMHKKFGEVPPYGSQFMCRQGSHTRLQKNLHFSRTFQNPRSIFTGPFRKLAMFKYSNKQQLLTIYIVR